MLGRILNIAQFYQKSCENAFFLVLKFCGFFFFGNRLQLQKQSSTKRKYVAKKLLVIK